MNPFRFFRERTVALIAGFLPKLQMWMIKQSAAENVYIDGITICDLSFGKHTREGFYQLTQDALALIKLKDARRYRRICHQVDYIVNGELISAGVFRPKFKICEVDYNQCFSSDDASKNLREYVLLLIHEATHGLICTKGIPYNKETRERIERLCALEEYRFARRFEPGYADALIDTFDPDRWKLYWDDSSAPRGSAWGKRIREALLERKASKVKTPPSGHL